MRTMALSTGVGILIVAALFAGLAVRPNAAEPARPAATDAGGDLPRGDSGSELLNAKERDERPASAAEEGVTNLLNEFERRPVPVEAPGTWTERAGGT